MFTGCHGGGPAFDPAPQSIVAQNQRQLHRLVVDYIDHYNTHRPSSVAIQQRAPYMCAIKDACSNRIVGWALDSRMKARLAVAALEMAVATRQPTGPVIVHVDRGSQFRSRKFIAALRHHGLVGSMGRLASAADNAAMESWFSLPQKNVLNQRTVWESREDLKFEII